MSTDPRRERLRLALGAPPPALPTGARHAAVAAVIRDAGSELEVLLIERALRAGDPWSGHMALPGGHYEPSDADLRATAERETREEVGLDLASAELLGALPDRSPARSNALSIRPFVFWLQARPTLSLSEEVTAALWVPLEPLARGERRSEHAFRGMSFPAWDIEGRVVWGFTYRVLEELLSALSSAG